MPRIHWAVAMPHGLGCPRPSPEMVCGSWGFGSRPKCIVCGVRVRARKGGGMVYGLDACRYVITTHSQTSCAHVQAHVQVIS